MYPHAFKYVRAESLEEASAQLLEFGEDAKALAGGQSLIPLMKLRLSEADGVGGPEFISGVGNIEEERWSE